MAGNTIPARIARIRLGSPIIKMDTIRMVSSRAARALRPLSFREADEGQAEAACTPRAVQTGIEEQETNRPHMAQTPFPLNFVLL